jgi:hypothetical protein
MENSINITVGGSEDCIVRGCRARAQIVSATYDLLPDSIRIAIAETASPADRAAVRAFVETLAARDVPPTPQEIDGERTPPRSSRHKW